MCETSFVQKILLPDFLEPQQALLPTFAHLSHGDALFNVLPYPVIADQAIEVGCIELELARMEIVDGRDDGEPDHHRVESIAVHYVHLDAVARLALVLRKGRREMHRPEPHAGKVFVVEVA